MSQDKENIVESEIVEETTASVVEDKQTSAFKSTIKDGKNLLFFALLIIVAIVSFGVGLFTGHGDSDHRRPDMPRMSQMRDDRGPGNMNDGFRENQNGNQRGNQSNIRPSNNQTNNPNDATIIDSVPEQPDTSTTVDTTGKANN